MFPQGDGVRHKPVSLPCDGLIRVQQLFRAQFEHVSVGEFEHFLEPSPFRRWSFPRWSPGPAEESAAMNSSAALGRQAVLTDDDAARRVRAMPARSAWRSLAASLVLPCARGAP